MYHLNEGHCGFMLFERIRRFLSKGMSFQEAREAVKATSVFTSHTPVPAGNETFDHSMMARYFSSGTSPLPSLWFILATLRTSSMIRTPMGVPGHTW